MYSKDSDHMIWSNWYSDWDDDLVEEYEGLTESERESIMYELNNDYLDDERTNLDIDLGTPIIIIGDLGLWYGRRSGYKVVGTGNISDCLRDDSDYVTWYVDAEGDFRCDAMHNDGTNYYLYRVFRDGTTDEQQEDLLWKIYSGTVTQTEIHELTEKIGTRIAEVYGW